MYTYLQLLERGNITPNFWCAEEYFEKAGLEEYVDGDVVLVVDGDWCVFPPIYIETASLADRWAGDRPIWSDFAEWSPDSNTYNRKFLDLEYIYDPKAFLQMDGGKWAVFRKNCRKWPRRFENRAGLRYDWIGASPFNYRRAMDEVLRSWLDGMKEPDEEIQDDEALLKYLYHGKNRKILFDRNGIYGINIWDENYRYINFRWCLCRPEDFLSEYMRLLFYLDPFILDKYKQVNDGGVLDDPDLKRFKDKMCPSLVREVYSWFRRRSGDEE